MCGVCEAPKKWHQFATFWCFTQLFISPDFFVFWLYKMAATLPISSSQPIASQVLTIQTQNSKWANQPEVSFPKAKPCLIQTSEDKKKPDSSLLFFLLPVRLLIIFLQGLQGCRIPIFSPFLACLWNAHCGMYGASIVTKPTACWVISI